MKTWTIFPFWWVQITPAMMWPCDCILHSAGMCNNWLIWHMIWDPCRHHGVVPPWLWKCPPISLTEKQLHSTRQLVALTFSKCNKLVNWRWLPSKMAEERYHPAVTFCNHWKFCWNKNWCSQWQLPRQMKSWMWTCYQHQIVPWVWCLCNDISWHWHSNTASSIDAIIALVDCFY